MKYSKCIGNWLKNLGYTHCFFVSGGGIMHLLDGFRDTFECIPVVHEVSAGISTEHFNETSLNGNKAFALVTTGPGLTNIVTAVAGCYVEHRELLVIAGQVKSTDLLKYKERQRGVQEVDGTSICSPISVYSCCLKSPVDEEKFISYVKMSKSPHPGPVVIEICLDVQGKDIIEHEIKTKSKKIYSEHKQYLPCKQDIIFTTNRIKEAKRPLFIFGGLLSRKVTRILFSQMEKIGIPVATTTSAIDRIPSDSILYAGRPGTWGGQRSGNLIVAQADLVIAVGAQLDLQQTGFDYSNYAPSAELIHVFPSKYELERIGPPAIKKILASPDIFMEEIISKLEWEDSDKWLKYVQNIRNLVPNIELANLNKSKYVNPFIFLKKLSQASKKSDVMAMCSSGGTFTGALQSFEIKKNQIATTSAAHASMGYGLATAIGVGFANPKKKILLTEGEGGFSQNLQELAVIKSYKLPIKIFIFDNNGYASIRSTQKKFFNGAYLGCDPNTGLGFPNWKKLFEAYDIPCKFIKKSDLTKIYLKELINTDGPSAWIVPVNPTQTNWPAVSTRLSKDGSMQSSPIFDMLPELSPEISKKVCVYIKSNQSS